MSIDDMKKPTPRPEPTPDLVHITRSLTDLPREAFIENLFIGGAIVMAMVVMVVFVLLAINGS